MARLRYNGLTAKLGADLLTAGTTITFTAALTHAAGAVPTITGTDYIPLAILADDGTVLEIMHLTAYTTGATTGTVLRAQESTTATTHGAGLRVVHGITVADTAELGGGTSEFVGCKVTRTAAYTLTSGAVTAIPWDTEVYDTHGFHDNATNNTRLTIPAGQAGVYDIGGTWVPNTLIGAGVRTLCRILVNGAEVWGTEIEGGGVNASPSAVTDHKLSVGDYVEFAYYIGSGSPPLYTNGSGFFLKKVGVL